MPFGNLGELSGGGPEPMTKTTLSHLRCKLVALLTPRRGRAGRAAAPGLWGPSPHGSRGGTAVSTGSPRATGAAAPAGLTPPPPGKWHLPSRRPFPGESGYPGEASSCYPLGQLVSWGTHVHGPATPIPEQLVPPPEGSRTAREGPRVGTVPSEAQQGEAPGLGRPDCGAGGCRGLFAMSRAACGVPRHGQDRHCSVRPTLAH